MRRITFSLIVAVVAVLGLSDGHALAQNPLPYSQPTYSPYLNLFRRGTPLYQNYYGLVRPQVEFNNNIQRLQQDVNANRQAILNQEGDVNLALPTTGHSFGYMTHRSFFLNNTSGGTSRTPGSRPGQSQNQPSSPRARTSVPLPRAY